MLSEGRLHAQPPEVARQDLEGIHALKLGRPADPGPSPIKGPIGCVEAAWAASAKECDAAGREKGDDLVDKDWWLGKTPEQQARKAKARTTLDNLKADKLEKEAAAQEKRALKMSKKIGRGGRRGMKATINAQGLREQAERRREAADSSVNASPDPTRPLGAEPVASELPPAPPAGWFPDPGAAARLRWWDGAQWTDHTSA